MIKNIFSKPFIAVALVTVALTGCKKEGAGGGPMLGKDDAAFAIYENSFLDALWKQNGLT